MGGFNNKDLYSLLVFNALDAKIDAFKEIEMRIDKMEKITSNKSYETFLKREQNLNNDVLKFWDKYWEDALP